MGADQEAERLIRRLIRDAQQAYETQCQSAGAESKTECDALDERKRAAARGMWLEPYVGPETTFPIRLGESGAGLTIYWDGLGVPYVQAVGGLGGGRIRDLAHLGLLLSTQLLS